MPTLRMRPRGVTTPSTIPWPPNIAASGPRPDEVIGRHPLPGTPVSVRLATARRLDVRSRSARNRSVFSGPTPGSRASQQVDGPGVPRLKACSPGRRGASNVGHSRSRRARTTRSRSRSGSAEARADSWFSGRSPEQPANRRTPGGAAEVRAAALDAHDESTPCAVDEGGAQPPAAAGDHRADAPPIRTCAASSSPRHR